MITISRERLALACRAPRLARFIDVGPFQRQPRFNRDEGANAWWTQAATAGAN